MLADDLKRSAEDVPIAEGSERDEEAGAQPPQAGGPLPVAGERQAESEALRSLPDQAVPFLFRRRLRTRVIIAGQADDPNALGVPHDQFDFRFQPSIDERQVRELATLTFVTEAANVRLLGPPGVGKTHLAVALGLRAIEAGQGVYFVRAHDLLEDLRRAQAEHRLDRRLRIYLAPKLLIVDEFGVWLYDRVAATALFTLISARYERGSVLLTSNKGLGEWGEVLGDPVVATAILDHRP